MGLCAALLAACAKDRGYRVDARALDVPVATVRERWISPEDANDAIDSLALYAGANGRPTIVATAKTSNRLRMFDLETGQRAGDWGGPGTAPGQFNRPNGIAIVDGFAFIAERDGKRVQWIDIERGKPLAVLGAGDMGAPYGVYVQTVDAGRYRIYVTDNYLTADLRVPPEAELGKRVRVFSASVNLKTREPRGWNEIKTFGDTQGEGVLRMVESIEGDGLYDRLLIAEEDADGGQWLKVYDYGGSYRRERVGRGVFAFQPEGIALLACDADGSGYWIASDQDSKRQRFHVFDRVTLAYEGSFRGEHVRETDGLLFVPGAPGAFPHGALLAQHADRGVVAFAWEDIAQALRLRVDCP
jgi:3-phytase